MGARSSWCVRSRLMDQLRHIAPIIAALLTLIVFAETTDVFGCPNQPVKTSRSSAGQTSSAYALDAAPTGGGARGTVLDHSSADDSSQGERRVPECLCQITFLSTAAPPAPKARDWHPVSYAIVDISVAPGVVLVPSPVPLTEVRQAT